MSRMRKMGILPLLMGMHALACSGTEDLPTAPEESAHPSSTPSATAPVPTSDATQSPSAAAMTPTPEGLGDTQPPSTASPTNPSTPTAMTPTLSTPSPQTPSPPLGTPEPGLKRFHNLTALAEIEIWRETGGQLEKINGAIQYGIQGDYQPQYESSTRYHLFEAPGSGLIEDSLFALSAAKGVGHETIAFYGVEVDGNFGAAQRFEFSTPGFYTFNLVHTAHALERVDCFAIIDGQNPMPLLQSAPLGSQRSHVAPNGAQITLDVDVQGDGLIDHQFTLPPAEDDANHDLYLITDGGEPALLITSASAGEAMVRVDGEKVD